MESCGFVGVHLYAYAPCRFGEFDPEAGQPFLVQLKVTSGREMDGVNREVDQGRQRRRPQPVDDAFAPRSTALPKLTKRLLPDAWRDVDHLLAALHDVWAQVDSDAWSQPPSRS